MRASMGSSQAEFAKAVGMKVWTLRGWEQGRFVPDFPDLILEALGARVKKFRRL